MGSERSDIDDKPLVRQWLWPLRTAFWIGVVAVCVWVYAIVVSTWWAQHEAPEAPVQRQLQALQADMARLDELQPRLFSPQVVARWIGDTLHDGLLTSFTKVARTFMNPPTQASRAHFNERSAVKTSKDPGGDYVRKATREAGADWDNLIVGTYVFATRTAYFLAGLPLVLLALGVGAVDGLVARARRKAEAGRESAGLYHRAKLGLSFALISGYLLCLGLPELPQAAQLMVPLALVCGCLLRLQASFYKKYL